MCRFRRDRVSISPGDRLEFVGDRLRFGEIFTEVENCRKREEVERVRLRSRNSAIQQQLKQQLQQAHGRPVRSTVGRSSRTIDRPVDRHARTCTADMHRLYRSTSPVDRLKVPNSRLGTIDRPGRPAGRPTVGSGCFQKWLFWTLFKG